jgi:murein DD-endopeptidase MepM/ murein hydrolase activator NlpD
VKLQKPWPDGYTINAKSPYGNRIHPITKRKSFHHGVDVAMPVGTQLTAPAVGTVFKKGKSDSGGFTLIIKHAENIYTVYYHLQKPSHLALKAKVAVGDPIALSGNTGASTGPHLHFEVRKSAKWGDTLDPVPFLEGL